MLNTSLITAATSRTRPRWLSQRSSRSYTIFVVSYAVFVDIFLYGVIVPVIPFALQQRIGIPFRHVQHWVSILLAVYGGSLLFFSLLAGYWADKMDTRRWPFLTGLLMLVGSTVMLCLARSITVMVIARILQGASAAVVWTVAVTVMTDRIGTKGLGQAMGYVTLGRSVAIVIGPLLGGVVYARAGYYAVYAMVFAFIVFDILFRLVLVEARVARQWDPCIIPLDGELELRAVEKSEFQENKSSPGTTPVATGPPHGQNPRRIFDLVPPTITLLANPRIATALWGCFWQASLLCGFDAVVPIFVKRTFGWNSFGAGLMFLAVVIPGFISPVVGHYSDKYGPKWLSVFGYLACAPPLILLCLVDHNSTEQKALLAALLSLLGAFCMFFEVSS
jgi:MFS family permease